MAEKKPTKAHMKRVETILRYLRNQLESGVKYGGELGEIGNSGIHAVPLTAEDIAETKHRIELMESELAKVKITLKLP